MKNKIICTILLLIIFSCSKNEQDELVNTNPHNLQDLGLSASNNIYPFWPDTFQYLGSNQWYDYRIGDTLVVRRRDEVTEDSGDEIEYRFLVKTNEWIKPLNVRRIRYEATINVDAQGNQIINPDSGLKFDKSIVNFRLQQYIENQVLACEIETQNGSYWLNYTLIDKMWVKLND